MMGDPNNFASIPMPSPLGNVVRVLATGAISVAITLVLWMSLVLMLDRRVLGYDNLLWSVTIWFSSLLTCGCVAFSRWSFRPVLACTVGFGVFSLAYMICESPIFGAPSQGGEPATTEFVVYNLMSLPIGVFAVTELACWMRNRRALKTTRLEIQNQTKGS